MIQDPRRRHQAGGGFVMLDVIISLSILLVTLACVLQSFVSFQDASDAALAKEYIALQLGTTGDALRDLDPAKLRSFSPAVVDHARGALSVAVDIDTGNGKTVRLPVASPGDLPPLPGAARARIAATFVTAKGRRLSSESTVALWGRQ